MKIRFNYDPYYPWHIMTCSSEENRKIRAYFDLIGVNYCFEATRVPHEINFGFYKRGQNYIRNLRYSAKAFSSPTTDPIELLKEACQLLEIPIDGP